VIKKKTVVLNDTSFYNHFGCEVVMDNIAMALGERGIDILYSTPVSQNWRADAACLAAIDACDIVIVNGEGTIHHGKEEGKWLVEAATYARERQKPAVLINATYQENDDSYIPHLKAFESIYVRETLSQAALQRQGVDATVVPDMTFFSTRQEHQRSGNKRAYLIGYSDSVNSRLSRQCYRLARRQGKQARYLPVLSDFKIKRWTPRRILKKAQFTLYRQLGKTVGRLLPIKMKYISYANIQSSLDHYFNAIRDLDLFVTGRFHSLCFSIQTATPFVTFGSNTHKVEGLIEDVRLDPERILTPDALKELEPEQLIQRFGTFSPEELERIRSYNAQALQKINAMFDHIREIADGRT